LHQFKHYESFTTYIYQSNINACYYAKAVIKFNCNITIMQLMIGHIVQMTCKHLNDIVGILLPLSTYFIGVARLANVVVLI